MSRQSGGFTLIEVLVALAILALATGSLLAIFSGAARNSNAAGRTLDALAVAENRLEVLSVADSLRPGTDEGVEADGYRWSARIEDAPGEGRFVSRLRPLLVTVEVTWQEGPRRRSLSLQSVRLADGGVMR